MSFVMMLLIVTGSVIGLLVIFKIYSGTLEMHEDDQLFLDAAESHMAKEQEEIRSKLEKVAPYITGLWIAAGTMIVVTIGTMLYQQLNRPMP